MQPARARYPARAARERTTACGAYGAEGKRDAVRGGHVVVLAVEEEHLREDAGERDGEEADGDELAGDERPTDAANPAGARGRVHDHHLIHGERDRRDDGVLPWEAAYMSSRKGKPCAACQRKLGSAITERRGGAQHGLFRGEDPARRTDGEPENRAAQERTGRRTSPDGEPRDDAEPDRPSSFVAQGGARRRVRNRGPGERLEAGGVEGE